MELFWQDKDGNYNDGGGLDLYEVWDEGSPSMDEEVLKMEIIFHIGLWAIEGGFDFNSVKGFTLDNDGDELEIQSNSGNFEWLDEVCKLIAHLKDSRTHYCPDNAILARIKDIDWKYFDFDADLQEAEDQYYQQWDGDAEEFAREHMSNCDESIPDYLERHFDYQSYGESLVDDFDQVEFANEEFLFSR